MNPSKTTKAVAALAALATMLVLFGAVTSIADSDQATLLAAKIAPVKIAVR